ncbi:autophagy protein, partial [Spiromyces aspiralis]
MSVYASMMLQNSASVSASHASSPDSRPALRLTENANRRFLAEHFVRRGSDPHSQQSVLLSVPGGKQTCSGGAVDSQAPGTLPDLSEGVPPADLQEDNANHAETNAGAQRAPADSFIMLSSSQIPDSGPTVAPIPQPSSLRSRVKHYNASGPSGEGPDLPSGKRAGAEGDSRADKSSGVDGGARAESREEPSSRPKTRRARGGDGEAVVSAGKTFEINQQFRVINRLMDVLEERSELRHPLCVDCAERMLKLLESGAVKLEKERAMYEGYLQTPRAEMPTGEECEQLKTVLDKQLEYEQTLSESLRELDRQLEDAVRELERLDARHRELDGKEQRIWREYNEFENRMANFGDEQAGLERQHEQNVVQLGYLQQVNV